MFLDGHLDGYISEQPVDVHWSNLASKGTVSSQGTSINLRQWPKVYPLIDLVFCFSVNDTSSVGSCEREDPGTPEGRGGHQMVIDHRSQMIYLHGGWDGANDLADLWRYDIAKKQWTCLFHDTSLEVNE